MNVSKMSPPLIVIGMHRSGTSMLARVLKDFSVHMGANLSENSECLFFQKINRDIISRHGSRWDLVRPATEALRSAEIVDQEVRKLEQQLIAKGQIKESFTKWQRLFWNIGGRPNWWGWKDPRNSITLPIWLRIFPESRVIHVVRNGIDVAISLHRREVKEGSTNPDAAHNIDNFAGYLRLWEDYVQVCREHRPKVREGNYREVRYEDILTDPRRELSAILEFLTIGVGSKKYARVIESINTGRLGNDKLRREFNEQIAALPESDFMKKLSYQ